VERGKDPREFSLLAFGGAGPMISPMIGREVGAVEVIVPNVPAIAESGVPGYEASTWHGWLAPAGTPPPIVNKLSAELARAARSPDLLDQLAADGAEPVGSTPVQFNRHLVTEIARWSNLVKNAGLNLGHD